MRSHVVLLACILVGCRDEVAPPPPSSAPRSEEALVAALLDAYRTRDWSTFLPLFSNEPGAEFLFAGSAIEPGTIVFGLNEWLRLNNFVFPRYIQVCDPPESPVKSFDIRLMQRSSFEERPEFYGYGLDPQRWRATEAQFITLLRLEKLDETAALCEGLMNLVIIEDRSKAPGAARKFLIYRWEEIEPEGGCWGYVLRDVC